MTDGSGNRAEGDGVLEGKLDDLQASEAIRRLVRDVARERSVVTDRRSNYLSVRPAPIGAIAAYFHAHKVSIAMEPLKAQALHLAGATHQKATPATTYVVVPAVQVSGAYGDVLELVRQAVDWRAQGPAMTIQKGRRGAAEKVEETCPNCWTTITPSGACLCEVQF